MKCWCFGGSLAVEALRITSYRFSEPWYSSRLPYFACQSKTPALIQFVQKLVLAFRLLTLP